jgi:hypothetical protein
VKRAGLLVGVLVVVTTLAAAAQDRGPAGGGSSGGGGPSKGGVVADPVERIGSSHLKADFWRYPAVAHRPRSCGWPANEPQRNPRDSTSTVFVLRLDDGATLGRTRVTRAVPAPIPCPSAGARV